MAVKYDYYFHGIKIQTLTGHTNRINEIDILPSGKVISISNDKSIKIWEQQKVKVITHDFNFLSQMKVLSANQIVILDFSVYIL